MQDKVSALRAVTSNVTKGPDSLLANIRLGALEQLDKDGDGTGVDNDLCLLSGARGNVGQSPGSLELDQGVRRAEKLYETADDVGLDDLLNGRVALFRQELAELCCGGNLVLNLL